MEREKITKIISILHKYINQDELKFIMNGLQQFNNYEDFFIEYSIKHIFENYEVNIEKRILFGFRYRDTDHNKYFDFMNIEQFDIKDYNNAVYFAYDKSNNLKKIYFEKMNVGVICHEYVDDKFNNVKIYQKKKYISENILNYIPETLRNILKDNYNYIFYIINKNLHIYQFKLKNILSYNDDFYCSVISIAFDNDYNIKYHTYYLRIKDKDINKHSPAVK